MMGIYSFILHTISHFVIIISHYKIFPAYYINTVSYSIPLNPNIFHLMVRFTINTLWLFNVAMGNPYVLICKKNIIMFIIELDGPFPIAMLNNQRVMIVKPGAHPPPPSPSSHPKKLLGHYKLKDLGD